jgi:ribosomal protein L15
MDTFVIIFMIVATIFSLGSLGYVAVDVILELRNKKVPVEEITEEPIIASTPTVDAAPIEVMPEIVEHIDAEEADAMISDALAMKTVRYESGAGHGQQGIINIEVLDANFNAHDVITLMVLKEKGLMPKKVGRMKILADGMLNKPLTIKSESYSIQAIKMIELTGGTVIVLKD